MQSWGEEASQVFIKLPWNSLTTSTNEPLLVKLSPQQVPNSAGWTLSILATDTIGCWYEHLSTRQLIRRFGDAFLDSQDTQSQYSVGAFTGVGEEGEKQLKDGLDQLTSAVSQGNASVVVEHAAYEHIISITTPQFTFKFVTDSLESLASSALSQHLLTPLLGLSSALLSLVDGLPVSENGSLEAAIDSSARAERLKEGRACQTFFTVGSSALARWIQRFNGVKDKHILPVTISSSFRRPSPSPFASTANVSPSKPKRPRSPSPAISTLNSASASPQKKSISQQMLDHKSRAPGTVPDRIGWEDSQVPGESGSSRTGPRSSGRDRLESDGESGGKRSSKEKGKVKEQEEEEPGTDEEVSVDEESLPFPPAAQPQRMDVEVADQNPLNNDEGEEEPATDDDGETPGPPSQTDDNSQLPPTPVIVTPPPPPPKESNTSKEEKKKRDKEAELAAEKEARKQTLIKAKAAAEAKAKGAAAAKKKKKL
ncbi:hypothetical protein T439DRAFT_379061 [Meredithblackwellia eburnea MCA 4105]